MEFKYSELKKELTERELTMFIWAIKDLKKYYQSVEFFDCSNKFKNELSKIDGSYNLNSEHNLNIIFWTIDEPIYLKLYDFLPYNTCSHNEIWDKLGIRWSLNSYNKEKDEFSIVIGNNKEYDFNTLYKNLESVIRKYDSELNKELEFNDSVIFEYPDNRIIMRDQFSGILGSRIVINNKLELVESYLRKFNKNIKITSVHEHGKEYLAIFKDKYYDAESLYIEILNSTNNFYIEEDNEGFAFNFCYANSKNKKLNKYWNNNGGNLEYIKDPECPLIIEAFGHII